MVSLDTLNIGGHLITGSPKKNHNFDNPHGRPHRGATHHSPMPAVLTKFVAILSSIRKEDEAITCEDRSSGKCMKMPEGLPHCPEPGSLRRNLDA